MLCHQPGGDSMRILVIRLSSLGDVLLATPVVRLLKRVFPDAELDIAVAQEFAAVWEHNPYINRVVAVDRTRDALAMAHAARRHLAKRYDLVIDLQRNIRSRALRLGLARRVLRVSKVRIGKLRIVWGKHTTIPLPHVVERYCRPLEQLGITDDDGGLELWLPEERSSADYPPTTRVKQSEQTIGLAPGARHHTKQWLPSGFVRVAKTLQEQGWNIVLFGSSRERDLCEGIAFRLDPRSTQIVVGNDLSMTARLLDRCTLLVCNDSAAVHIAAARRVPVVVVYGSTVPAFGFTPYCVPHRIVEVELPCRPCTHIGRARCPRGHFGCMHGVTAEHVLVAVQSLITELAVSDGYRSH